MFDVDVLLEFCLVPKGLFTGAANELRISSAQPPTPRAATSAVVAAKLCFPLEAEHACKTP